MTRPRPWVARAALCTLLLVGALSGESLGQGGVSLSAPKIEFEAHEPIMIVANAPPGSNVTFEVEGPAAAGGSPPVEMILTARADASGVASVSFRLPDPRPGTHTVYASVNSTAFAELRINVLAAALPARPVQSFPIFETGLVTLILLGAAVSSSSRGNLAFASLVLVPAFTRIKRDEAKNQYQRGRIAQFITDNPGASYSEIRRRLSLSNGACAYHLRVLEKSSDIKRIAQGPTVRFFPFDYKFDAEALPPLAYVQRLVLELLAEISQGTTGEVAARLRARDAAVSEPNVSYHLRVLAREKQLISSRRDGGKTVYFLDSEQKEYVTRRLKEEFAADGFLARTEFTEPMPWLAGVGAPAWAPPAAAPPYFVEEVFVFAPDGALLHRATAAPRKKTSRPTASKAGVVRGLLDRAPASGAPAEEIPVNGFRVILAARPTCTVAATVHGDPGSAVGEAVTAAADAADDASAASAALGEEWEALAARLAAAAAPVIELSKGGSAEVVQRALAEEPLSVVSETDFVAGFVRLKVAVRNRNSSVLADVALELDYPELSLRLDRVQPDYPWVRGRFQLGNLPPHEKRTAEFYFDPQVCTESFFEGDVKYRDGRGSVRNLRMRRRRVHVVCPVLLTEKAANTASLRNLVTSVLPAQDRKVFLYPQPLGPEGSFELAKEVVASLDVRPVRDFVEMAPFHGEAWFYGETKVRASPLAIRVTVAENLGTVEFLAAAEGAPAVTGLLAELHHRLAHALQERRGYIAPDAVTGPDELAAQARIPVLLLRSDDEVAE